MHLVTNTKTCQGCMEVKPIEEMKKIKLYFCDDFEELCLECRKENKRSFIYSKLESDGERFTDEIIELNSDLHWSQEKVNRIKNEIDKIRKQQQEHWAKLRDFDWSQDVEVE